VNKLFYYKELDGVRAVASLIIMFFHFFQHLSVGGMFLGFLKKVSFIGQTGVSLFFVLSGFLITRILLSNKHSKKYFTNFYIRRALRIFPLYYLFLIIFYFILPLFLHFPYSTFNLQFYYWIFLQNIAITFNWERYGPGHFWTLAVEEHFYLIWPVIIYYFDFKRIFFIIKILIIIAFFFRGYLEFKHLEIYYFSFSRMDELAIGSLLALMELKDYFKPKYNSIYLILMLAVFIPAIFLWLTYSGSANSIIQVVKYTIISLIYFLFIGYLISKSDKSILKQFFKSSFMSYTGKISFGLYVYHPVCFNIVENKFSSGNQIFNLIVALIFTYLIATISYYAFESKILKLKERFTY